MNLSMLDVAIGLAFVYLLVSLICSAILEVVESWLQKRSSDLIRGIYQMLKDPDSAKDQTALLREFYNHPLITSLYTGKKNPGQQPALPDTFTLNDLKSLVSPHKNLPDYIPARVFVLTLIDLYNNAPGKVPQSVRDALRPMLDAAKGDINVASGQIQEWYDSTMDSVSGEFKRNRQKWLLALGFILSVAFNIDTLAITKSLSDSPELRASLVKAADEFIKEGMTGYVNGKPDPGNGKPATDTGDASAPAKPSAAGKVPAPDTTPTPETTPTAGGTPTVGSTPSAGQASAPKITPEPSGTPATSNTPARATTPPSGPTPTPMPDPKAGQKALDYIGQLEKSQLPIGWNATDPRTDWRNLDKFGRLLKLLGWIVTGLAVSLGAPFWFDLLNRFMIVRSTVKPKEKSPNEKAIG